MSDFAAVVTAGDLNGTNGFEVVGDVSGQEDLSGWAVSSAGDVNGDGIDDFIIASAGGYDSYSGRGYAGAAYVVFGKASGFPAQFQLSSLNGSNGFKLTGEQDWTAKYGITVGAAGDINGDGFDDILVGLPFGYVSGRGLSGVSYVVFGKASGFHAIESLALLTGSNGFKIAGEFNSSSGYSLSLAGDINHDSFDDIIVGSYTGHVAYVVFGKSGGFGSTLDLATLDGSNGFKFHGLTGGPFQTDTAGRSVSTAGDVNGDGIDDIIIGAPYGYQNSDRSGSAYVIFGHSGSFSADMYVANLDGTNGFTVIGANYYDFAGLSVSSAGDVNGDGVNDILVAAPKSEGFGAVSAGAVYVVFGKNTGFSATLDVNNLNGSNGFAILGFTAYMYAGSSVAAAGDINGDGIDDLIIGTKSNYSTTGLTYVVYGKDTGFAASLLLNDIDGSNGFVFTDSRSTTRYTGHSFVSSAGDVNGDGAPDILVGNRNAPGSSHAGSTYVIYGKVAAASNWTGGTGNDTHTGTSSAETLSGGDGNDIINGGGGNDTLNGDAGDDTLDGGTGADALTGGIGDDTYYVDDAGDTTTENSGEGYDTVRATLNWTLGANLEALILEGSSNINGTGNGLDNTLTGNDGNNTLSGGAGKDILYGGIGTDILDGGSEGDWLDGGTGADTMSGGTGDDTYVVDNLSDVTTENSGEGNDVVVARISWTLGGNIERLILDTGYGDINGTGNSLANTMVGNEGKNTLDGGDGEDIIKGGAGDDTLLGGNGADMLYGGDGVDDVDGQGGNDILNGGNGDDIIFGGVGADILDGGADNDTLDGGTGSDQLNGGVGTDSLSGGDGNDVLDGGTGADTMTGGIGDDTYYVDNAGDTTVEVSGEGTDLVRATINWTLLTNTENMVLDGVGNIDGTGNSVSNAITGNGGNNVLDGAAGDDVLKGGNGADTLIGGVGADILVGGAGADTFVVTQASVRQSHLGGALEVDTVNDLNLAQNDRLDLSAIDADSNTIGDQAFHLVSAFTNHAGEMTLSFAGGITVLTLDVDGDGAADYRMKITGDVHLDSGGWIL